MPIILSFLSSNHENFSENGYIFRNQLKIQYTKDMKKQKIKKLRISNQNFILFKEKSHFKSCITSKKYLNDLIRNDS